MSGIGEESHPTEWQALRDAAQAYGAAIYGPEYIVNDFVMIGFVVSMAGETEYSEYALATSSAALHINEGLTRRALDMLTSDPTEE